MKYECDTLNNTRIALPANNNFFYKGGCSNIFATQIQSFDFCQKILVNLSHSRAQSSGDDNELIER